MLSLFTHAACLEHDTGPGHPERADRLRAVWRALEHPDFQAVRREEPPAADRAQLELVHPAAYVDRILSIRPPAPHLHPLDPDTLMSAGSAEAALRAAGAACAAVDAVMTGRADAAFAAVRPPGHHAEPGRAMGFCLFGNAALAAMHARARWGLRRVAVADFDVHHGNGTQAMLQDDPELFFASSHQQPCYPGTGDAGERGIAGNVLNLPLPPGSGPAAFRSAWQEAILPALDRFAPELLVVSAGFDAHRDDPLAQLQLDADDFAWVTRGLMQIADRRCGGRIVSILEGGYDLAALAESTAAHVRALMRAPRADSSPR